MMKNRCVHLMGGRAAFLASAAMLVLATGAGAHAQLDHASPKVGATVDAAPARVEIWFDDDVDPAGTAIQVSDAAGSQVDLKDARQDGKDKTLMTVGLPATLAAGTYTVKWNATCMQGHKTQGEFKFTVEGKK